MTKDEPVAWEGGKCRVAMWSMGAPAGLCGEQAFGPQLPIEVLRRTRTRLEYPHCYGPCCPNHGGPKEGEPIVFEDGLTPDGRPMWCAVMPDFQNLQESPAGYSRDGNKAIANLRAALSPEGH